MVTNAGVYGHISDALRPGEQRDHVEDLPSLPPVLPQRPSQADVDWRADWWWKDGQIKQLMLSTISVSIQSSIPDTQFCPDGTRVTARDVYWSLRELYGNIDYGSAIHAEKELRSARCGTSSSEISKFVLTWRRCRNIIETARYTDLSLRSMLQILAESLPHSPNMNVSFPLLQLHHDISEHARVTPTADLPSIENCLMQLTTIATNIQNDPALQPPSRQQRTAKDSASSTTASTSSASKPITCSNCKSSTHPLSDCWRRNGPMYGQRDAVLARKAAASAALQTANGSSASTSAHTPSGSSTQKPPRGTSNMAAPAVASPSGSLSAAAASSTSPVSAPAASTVPVTKGHFGMPVFSSSCDPDTSPPANDLILFDDQHSFHSSHRPDAVDFDLKSDPLYSEVEHAAYRSSYQAVLDTGCTLHCFESRSCFWTYSTTDLPQMKTANCGLLNVAGMGDIHLAVSLDNIRLILILRNCLHTPDVPINLLSVGQWQESGFAIHFPAAPDMETKIFLPTADDRVSGHHFTALRVGRLSFLDCHVLTPPNDNDPGSALPPHISMPAFTPAALTPDLWHRRLGHPGLETTKKVLTRNYASGVQYRGSFDLSTRCTSCIIGKTPQHPYDNNARRADSPLGLLHMDLCGPYPVQTPRKERHWIGILDDHMNYGSGHLLVSRDQSFDAYIETEARWELQTGKRVHAVRIDGAKELAEGRLRDHFKSRGIQMQVVAPYAHSQNGKAERWVRTIQDRAVTLLADCGGPPSLWGWAVLCAIYLHNVLPSSTLPDDITPHERMFNKKPDLAHLRPFGCLCYPIMPPELRPKGSPRRFEAVFIGYDVDRVGWYVRDFNGKTWFSRDVIFNETESGFTSSHIQHFRRRRSPRLHADPSTPATPPPTRVLRSHSVAAFTDLISSRDAFLSTCRITPTHDSPFPLRNLPFLLALDDLNDLFPASEYSSLTTVEPTILASFHSYHSLISRGHIPRTFNPDRPPDTFREAVARPDAAVWRLAMERELASLRDRGAFFPTTLPKGRRAIGLRWVYAFKMAADGSIIRGKEKARLVAKGFSQRPEDFGETYAPVARLASLRILFAYATSVDLEIFSFDVKTAFLHAKLPVSERVYASQIPGFPLDDLSLVLEIRVALYGLRQSACEWYKLISSILISLGLRRSDMDHAVFIGVWTTPPDPSIPLPDDGRPLVLIVPIYVDDGLGLTNSAPLYLWLIKSIQGRGVEVIDLGPVVLFIGHRILRDRTKRILMLSQRPSIVELLEQHGLLDCTAAAVPMPIPLHKLPPPQPNAFPDVPDSKIKVEFQSLVGSLIYIAICTRPDIMFAASSLGRYNANPTRAHLIAAKTVLRYLKGTLDYVLVFPTPCESIPPHVAPHTNACTISDADWAGEAVDCRSISGYACYYHGALVSWCSAKQGLVAPSSTKSEYYSLSHAVREALWMRLFLASLDLPLPTPFPLLCDNQSTIAQANNPNTTNSARTKHIDVRYHFVRERIADGTFHTVWVPTGEMVADLFTKALPFPIFSKLRASLGIVPDPMP